MLLPTTGGSWLAFSPALSLHPLPGQQKLKAEGKGGSLLRAPRVPRKSDRVLSNQAEGRLLTVEEGGEGFPQ